MAGLLLREGYGVIDIDFRQGGYLKATGNWLGEAYRGGGGNYAKAIKLIQLARLKFLCNLHRSQCVRLQSKILIYKLTLHLN